MSAALAMTAPVPARRPIARYAVVGAGAIGAYVGASIARAGRDVTLIARGPHLCAMQEEGVRVHSERGDFHVRCSAVDMASAEGPFDCLIIALKATQLGAALPSIRRLCHDQTEIVGMQNGVPWWYFQRYGGPHEGRILESVDPGGRLAAAFDPDHVVGCVIYSSTELERPGVVRHIEGTRYALGRPSGGTDAPLEQIASAFVAGGLKAPIERDLRVQIWVKLIGNVALNPISALTGATLGRMLSDPAIEALVREIMEEAVTIARALGIELPISIDKRIDGARRVGDHKTSMLQDVERGRPLELDCMTGAIVELGEILGIPTPKTRQLHALTQLLDRRLQAA